MARGCLGKKEEVAPRGALREKQEKRLKAAVKPILKNGGGMVK